jgi:ABC-type Zn uptake system ZnuABC Zn-binding protein ZnuA
MRFLAPNHPTEDHIPGECERAALRPILLACFLLAILPAGCSGPPPVPASGLRVIATETFLADIARQVAGSRFTVDALIPYGLDPHGFEPTPQDIARVSESDILIVNGAGAEGWLEPMLANIGGQRRLIVASNGLQSRPVDILVKSAGSQGEDPHFWLDPVLVVRYVENIRDGFLAADPDGESQFRSNAEQYIAQLRALDGWIRTRVSAIPASRRLLVTNHETFGYFADRYGFRIVGTILPGVSTDAEPTAQQLAQLTDRIRSSGVKAIFLEQGTNAQMADQLARETGVKVIDNLLTHSTTPPDGDAPTYLDMLKFDVNAIVDALQ